MVNYPKKERYQLSDLQEIVRILREPGGCPWDREQSHDSICRDMIEEAYEVVDAIRQKSQEGLQEELGDVLLQVVFHTRIEEEQQHFQFEDVTDGVCRKLIYRHPHVFADTEAETTEAVLENWEQLKQVEKSQHSQTEVLRAVPASFPALMRNEKVQKKAEKGGRPAPDAAVCAERIRELLNGAVNEEQIGGLLAAVVALGRTAGVRAEEALTAETERYLDDFAAWETAKTGEKAK